MLKKFYLLAWILLAMGALVTALAGSFDPAALVVFSLLALGLVHTLILWSVIVNTREAKAG